MKKWPIGLNLKSNIKRTLPLFLFLLQHFFTSLKSFSFKRVFSLFLSPFNLHLDESWRVSSSHLKNIICMSFQNYKNLQKKIFHIQIVLWCLFQSNEQTPHFCTFLYIISHSTQEYNLPRWWSSSVPRLYAQKPHLPSTARNTSMCLLFSPSIW